MRLGKPIINTKLGTGVNYVSIDGETGLTVEPKESKELSKAINKLLQDDNLRINFGENSLKRIKDIFNINIIKNQYKNLYELGE